MHTRCLLACITAAVFWAPASWSASSFPDRYDRDIRQASERWMPTVDWRLWKAQLYQESLLDPEAESPVGAEGVAQFMPATWAEVSEAMGYEGVSPRMAGPAIRAGAYYMARQRRIWSSPRPEADRHSLAMASYNAGAGNLIAAQRACGGVTPYAEIVTCLPEITGHHSRETITYVRRIWGYWRDMLLGA